MTGHELPPIETVAPKVEKEVPVRVMGTPPAVGKPDAVVIEVKVGGKYEKGTAFDSCDPTET